MLTNSDYTFTLSVSTGNYACKPSKEEMHKIAFVPFQLTVETALQCANQGKAFCYTFKSKNNDGYLPIKQKKVENFVSTSTIIYDFDDMEVNMTDYISQIPFKPSFAYPTYSDGKNGLSRFRLAYVFDKDIQGEENFDEIYHAIANANQFIRETKEHGGWDVRNVAQMYYGTTSTAKTYKSDYIYNVSDFAPFIVPVTKEEKSKNRQSKNLNASKYKDIDKTFLYEFNNLPYLEFFKKYFDTYYKNYQDSLETSLTLSPNEMWYEYPDDYVAILRKRCGKYTLKWDVGQDRKKKLYLTAQMMVHNLPNITLENLIYNLNIERYYYYDNHDNKLDNQVLIQTAVNAYNKRINLNPSKHGGYRVNKEFWQEQGINAHQAKCYIKREQKIQEVLPYIDSTKTVKQNHDILTQNGVKISLRTLYRMVTRGDIEIVMVKQCSPTLSYQCRNVTNHEDIVLELIRNNNEITLSEIASILDMDKRSAQRIINKMRGKSIDRIGNNRSGHWMILDTCTTTETIQEYSSTCTMSEFELLAYNFENNRTTIETPHPMTDDELREDMFNDGWTEQEILDFFSIYAVA